MKNMEILFAVCFLALFSVGSGCAEANKGVGTNKDAGGSDTGLSSYTDSDTDADADTDTDPVDGETADSGGGDRAWTKEEVWNFFTQF